MIALLLCSMLFLATTLATLDIVMKPVALYLVLSMLHVRSLILTMNRKKICVGKLLDHFLQIF